MQPFIRYEWLTDVFHHVDEDCLSVLASMLPLGQHWWKHEQIHQSMVKGIGFYLLSIISVIESVNYLKSEATLWTLSGDQLLFSCVCAALQLEEHWLLPTGIVVRWTDSVKGISICLGTMKEVVRAGSRKEVKGREIQITTTMGDEKLERTYNRTVKSNETRVMREVCTAYTLLPPFSSRYIKYRPPLPARSRPARLGPTLSWSGTA